MATVVGLVDPAKGGRVSVLAKLRERCDVEPEDGFLDPIQHFLNHQRF